MSRKSNATLKGLKEELKKRKGSLESKEIQFKTLKQDINTDKQRISNLIRTISDLESKELDVSDHALVRYLERVYDLDIELVKSQILTPENIALIDSFAGNGKFTFNNMQMLVKNNTIITIIT